MKIDLETVKNYVGLGDLVMWSWLAEGSRTGPDPITIHRKRDLELTQMLGLPTDSEPGGLNADAAYVAELKDRCRLPRVDYIRLYLKVRTPLVRPTLRLSAQDEAWADEEVGKLGRLPVLLFPQCAWKPREWPAAYWVDLAWMLKGRNIPALTLLGTQDDRFKNAPAFWWGCPVPRVAALMKRAALVVGSDSFAAHLAGAVGVPTLALLGPTRANTFAHCREVECLFTGHIDCVGCHFQAPFRAACDQGCQALYRVYPDEVMRRVCEKVSLR